MPPILTALNEWRDRMRHLHFYQFDCKLVVRPDSRYNFENFRFHYSYSRASPFYFSSTISQIQTLQKTPFLMSLHISILPLIQTCLRTTWNRFWFKVYWIPHFIGKLDIDSIEGFGSSLEEGNTLRCSKPIFVWHDSYAECSRLSKACKLWSLDPTMGAAKSNPILAILSRGRDATHFIAINLPIEKKKETLPRFHYGSRIYLRNRARHWQNSPSCDCWTSAPRWCSINRAMVGVPGFYTRAHCSRSWIWREILVSLPSLLPTEDKCASTNYEDSGFW